MLEYRARNESILPAYVSERCAFALALQGRINADSYTLINTFPLPRPDQSCSSYQDIQRRIAQVSRRDTPPSPSLRTGRPTSDEPHICQLAYGTSYGTVYGIDVQSHPGMWKHQYKAGYIQSCINLTKAPTPLTKCRSSRNEPSSQTLRRSSITLIYSD